MCLAPDLFMKLVYSIFSPSPSDKVAREQKREPWFNYKLYAEDIEKQRKRRNNLDEDRQLQRFESKVRFDSDVDLQDIDDESRIEKKESKSKHKKDKKDKKEKKKDRKSKSKAPKQELG